jgi:dihydrofolate reductase
MTANRLTLIVAMTPHSLIGVDGKIPWHIPADLKRFKKLTMGHAMIMGRKTFESIGKPLPGRHTIVLTRQTGWSLQSPTAIDDSTTFEVARHYLDALHRARAYDSAPFVIGGAQIYECALGFSDDPLTNLEITYSFQPVALEPRTHSTYFPYQAGTWPALRRWRCTSITRPDNPDGTPDLSVEFHSYERRLPPIST